MFTMPSASVLASIPGQLASVISIAGQCTQYIYLVQLVQLVQCIVQPSRWLAQLVQSASVDSTAQIVQQASCLCSWLSSRQAGYYNPIAGQCRQYRKSASQHRQYGQLASVDSTLYCLHWPASGQLYCIHWPAILPTLASYAAYTGQLYCLHWAPILPALVGQPTILPTLASQPVILPTLASQPNYTAYTVQLAGYILQLNRLHQPAVLPHLLALLATLTRDTIYTTLSIQFI